MFKEVPLQFNCCNWIFLQSFFILLKDVLQSNFLTNMSFWKEVIEHAYNSIGIAMFECKAFINPTMKCDYKLLFEDSKIETQKFNIDLSQIVLLENLPARM